jgi:hypothetical protein
MTRVAIPQWNARGVLPPVDATSATSAARSPYVVPLTEVILRYATSPERRIILDGFLRFREALASAGFRDGFQWLDGSFLEDIELIENRPPRDIDLVTFYSLPVGLTQQELFHANPPLFDRMRTKADYRVDAYFVQLNTPQPEVLVRSTAYWYSLWSHRRDDVWRGYLQVDLAPTENAPAKANLTAMAVQGGTP